MFFLRTLPPKTRDMGKKQSTPWESITDMFRILPHTICKINIAFWDHQRILQMSLSLSTSINRFAPVYTNFVPTKVPEGPPIMMAEPKKSLRGPCNSHVCCENGPQVVDARPRMFRNARLSSHLYSTVRWWKANHKLTHAIQWTRKRGTWPRSKSHHFTKKKLFLDDWGLRILGIVTFPNIWNNYILQPVES